MVTMRDMVGGKEVAQLEMGNKITTHLDMMQEIKKEFETLKRKNVKEIEALRAENDHLRRKVEESNIVRV